MDNSSKIGSSFQLRESQSHGKSRGEQNDLFEQHHSQYKRPNSSLPQFNYEAFSPQLNYVDTDPWTSPSAGNVYVTCI